MSKAAIPAFALLCALILNAQSDYTRRKIPETKPPACAPGAICFSGEVSADEEFRKTLNADLEFVLSPGWTITIVPQPTEADCKELASVVNPPYRTHRDLYIDTSYGWTAEEEVSRSPREFRFVTNCADYRIESDRLGIVLWPYTATQQKYDEALAKLGTSRLGTGRLWITNAKITHADDTPGAKRGRIQWMKFSIEVILPR